MSGEDTREALAEAWWRGRRSANERQGEWAGPELRERCAKDIADLAAPVGEQEREVKLGVIEFHSEEANPGLMKLADGHCNRAGRVRLHHAGYHDQADAYARMAKAKGAMTMHKMGHPGYDDDPQYPDDGPSDWDSFFSERVNQKVEHEAGRELARQLVLAERQRESLRSALHECIAMLRSATVWPAEDIQGLRYHTHETANRATTVLATVDAQLPEPPHAD